MATFFILEASSSLALIYMNHDAISRSSQKAGHPARGILLPAEKVRRTSHEKPRRRIIPGKGSERASPAFLLTLHPPSPLGAYHKHPRLLTWRTSFRSQPPGARGPGLMHLRHVTFLCVPKMMTRRETRKSPPTSTSSVTMTGDRKKKTQASQYYRNNNS